MGYKKTFTAIKIVRYHKKPLKLITRKKIERKPQFSWASRKKLRSEKKKQKIIFIFIVSQQVECMCDRNKAFICESEDFLFEGIIRGWLLRGWIFVVWE